MTEPIIFKGLKKADLLKLGKELSVKVSKKMTVKEIKKALADQLKNSLDEKTVNDLKDLAEKNGIELKKSKKVDIVEEILANAEKEALKTFLKGVEKQESPVEKEADVSKDKEETEASEEMDITSIAHDLENTRSILDTFDSEYIDRLDEKRREELSLGKMESALNLARVRVDDGNYGEALIAIDSILKDGKISFERFEEVACASAISATIRMLKGLAPLIRPEDVAGIPEQMEKIKKDLDNNDLTLEDVEPLLKSSLELYSNQKNILEEMLARQQEEITSLGRMGADVFNSRRYFNRAIESLAEGDIIATHDYLSRSRRMSNEAITEWKLSIEKMVSQVTEMIKETKDFGADVVEAEALLEKARKALSMSDHTLASELIIRAEGKAAEAYRAERAKAGEISMKELEKAKKALANVGPLVQEAMLYNMDVSDINNMLQRARFAIQTEDADNASNYAVSVEKMSITLKRDIEKQRIYIIQNTRVFDAICPSCQEEKVKYFSNDLALCLACGHMFRAVPGGPGIIKKIWKRR